MPRIYKELAKFILVTNFGRNSVHSVRTAVLRIFCASIAAILLSSFLAKYILNMALPVDIPVLVVCATIALAIFVIDGFVMLTIGNLGVQGSGTTVNKLLITLPLNRRHRWFVIILPLALISLTLSCLYIPVVVALSRALHVSVLACLGAMFLGLVSSVGYVLIKMPYGQITKTFIFVLQAGVMIWFLDLSIKAPSVSVQNGALFSIILLQIIDCYGYLQSFKYTVAKNEQVKLYAHRLQIPKWLLAKIWFSLKLLRNRRALASYVFCLITGAALALSILIRHQVNLAGLGWLLFAAFLVCSFAGEVRGLSRRYKTPEVVSLKGTQFFIDSQLAATLILNLLIMIPLVIVVLFAGQQPITSVLVYSFSLLTAGTLVGLLSSTLFVPQAGEIGSQFFTAIVALAGLLGAPKVLKFSNQSIIVQSLLWLCLGAACYLLMIIIENIRRKNYGNA